MRNNNARRVLRGVTLIELLVVISILMLLTMLAIPRVRPAAEARRIREAARAVSVYVSAAQNRARELGRPCGLEIVRDPDLPNGAVVLHQVEAAPTYAGDVTSARVAVQNWTFYPDGQWYWRWSAARMLVLKVMVREGDFSPGLVRRGELAQLDNRGPLYTIIADPLHDPAGANPAYPKDFPVDDAGFINFAPADRVIARNPNPPPMYEPWITNYCLTLVLRLDEPRTLPWPAADPNNPAVYIPPNPPSGSGNYDQFVQAWGADKAVPIKFFRMPNRSAVAPLKLPKNVAIDLAFSGIEVDPTAFRGFGAGLLVGGTYLADYSPVMIMFRPSGGVDSLWLHGWRETPLGRIYLLVGDHRRVPPEVDESYFQNNYASPSAEDGKRNVQIPSNLWVAINCSTGFVYTTELAEIEYSQPPDFKRDWVTALSFAREAQTMGGR